MGTAKSTLQFRGYETVKMVYSIVHNDPGDSKETGQCEIQPKYRRKVTAAQDGQYSILLGVLIEPTGETDRLPIRAQVELVGHFSFQNDQLIANATAILFPYLRATLSMLMSAAGVLPFVLPTMNIVKLFENSEEQSTIQANQSDN